MTKKITMKHFADGKVFTRTTARSYTHVVLAKTNVDAAIAQLKAGRDAQIKQAKEDAVWRWDYALYNSTHEVGDVSYSKKYIITQTDRDEAVDFFQKNGHLSRDQYILTKKIECSLNIDQQIKKLEESTPTWDVAAWSGSRDLAMKACSQWERWNNFTRVEAINNGVAA